MFLAGNGLPGRWRGRPSFTVLETGFGLGHNFLATWAAWRADPQRPERLHFISVEKHPLRLDDLRRAHAAHSPPAAADASFPDLAHALCEAWPPLTPDLHRLCFDCGRVELLLAFGDAREQLREIVASVDTFFLDGFAPDRNPEMWEARLFKAVSRLAAPGATAATWSAATVVRDGLRGAGFEVERAPGTGGKRDITVARFAPRVRIPQPVFRVGRLDTRRVVVVGGGLAGAFAARALVEAGLECLVVDQAAVPASGASGQPAGLFHGVFHAPGQGEGTHARALRGAALMAHPVYRQAIADGVPGQADGLLRLDDVDLDAMAFSLRASGLPSDYLQTWPADAVRARGGPDQPAWYYPGGGWIGPDALVRWALDAPGIEWRGGVAVARLASPDPLDPAQPRWRLLDAHGACLLDADAVVLANAARACDLLATVPAASDALQAHRLAEVRGQTTRLAPGSPGLPRLAIPLAGAGYAIPLPDGGLLCGATSQRGDIDPGVRCADHQINLTRLSRLTATTLPSADSLLDAGSLHGRVGWRATSPDRLPWIGAVPASCGPGPGRRPEHPRHWPRVPGLFVLAGLGSRGLTWAPLAGRLLAAWITDAPFPLPARLVHALDPARFAARNRHSDATPRQRE